MALLTRELIFVDANTEFLRIRGLTHEQLVGRHLSEDRPANDRSFLLKILASLGRVADTGERDTLALERHDVPDPDRPGVWHERYWTLTNVPVFGPDGRLAPLLRRVEDVTEITELIRAREVALTLQEAMLPAPRPGGRHPEPGASRRGVWQSEITVGGAGANLQAASVAALWRECR